LRGPRQRIQQHRPHPTENGSAGPDSNSNRQDRDNRKTRITCQGPQAVTKIAQEGVHDVSEGRKQLTIANAPATD
jgi:hypothetical protein